MKLPNKNVFQYTRQEEMINAGTHAIGVVMSGVIWIYLIHKSILSNNLTQIISYSIYSLSLLMLFFFSATYHLVQTEKMKILFKKLDHISIYFMIAGTYTPFMMINLKEDWGHTILTIIWSLALIGTSVKIFSKKRNIYISVITYLGMGWLIVAAYRPMLQHVPPLSIKWLAIGGVSYTVGVIFYLLKKVRHHHAVWHILVLLGCFSHFMAIHYAL